MSYVIQQLTALPFENIIGGPLKAAIEAQGMAAKATVDFIALVGFEPTDTDPFFADDATKTPDMGDVRNVTFNYISKDADGGERESKLTVPILMIVPIPFLRIDEMTIDFMAKISETRTATHSTKADTSFKTNFKLGYRAFWSPVSVSFQASFSTKHSSTAATSSRYQMESTINIHVRAVQDDIPAGLSRILDILEKTITEVDA